VILKNASKRAFSIINLHGNGNRNRNLCSVQRIYEQLTNALPFAIDHNEQFVKFHDNSKHVTLMANFKFVWRISSSAFYFNFQHSFRLLIIYVAKSK